MREEHQVTTPPNHPPHGQSQGFPEPGVPVQPPVPPQYRQPGEPGHAGFPQAPGHQGQPPQYQQHQPQYQPQYQQPAAPGYPQGPGHQEQPSQYQPGPGYPQDPAHQGLSGQYQPHHQQPGQPGYPQQLPQPPATGTSRGAKALIAVVGVGIVGVVVAGIIASTTAPAGAEVGECIKVVSSTATSTKVDKIDCSSREATFKVAANLDSSTASCPSGDYSKYSDRGGRRSDGFALCLMLNAAEGECFKQEGSRSADAVKVTCDSSATHKVVKVSEGRSDENECASGEIVFVYSQPATTICMVEE